jgi:FkbM family methyltransferase
MKRVLRSLLRRAGLDVVSERTDIGLELILRLQRLRSKPPFHFIQVGAQDGVTGDPVRDLVEGGSWTGVLVEPRRSMFERLLQNYSFARGLRFINCAIAPVPGEKILYALDDRDRSLPAWSHGLGTFDRDLLLRHESHIPDIRSRIVSELVQCRTWDDLLDEVRPVKVDLLQIDVEGMDYELIRTFPLARARPGVIRYEHSHLSVADRAACEQFLIANGYTPVVADRDTTALERLFRSPRHGPEPQVE